MTEHIRRPRRSFVFTQGLSPAADPRALMSGAKIESARRIIRTFDEADGLPDVIDAKQIEMPVLRDMRRIVAIADREEDRQ